MNRTLSLLVVLAACTATDQAAVAPDAGFAVGLDAPAPPPGPGLNVVEPTLVAGTSVDVTIEGGYPGETVYLLASKRGLGTGPCPAQIGGQCLGFAGPPKLIGTGTVDGTGTTLITLNVPGHLPDAEVALQAVIVRGIDGVDSSLSDPILATVIGAGGCTEVLGFNVDGTVGGSVTGYQPLAMKVPVPQDMIIDRVEVMTGGQVVSNRLEVWDHDAAGDQPGTELAGGDFTLAVPVDWQGTELDQRVPMRAGDTYWVVWRPFSGSQFNEAIAGDPVTYKGSVDGGNSWHGPYQGELMLKLFTCP